MSLLELFIIGLTLALDAAIVAMAAGALEDLDHRQVLEASALFAAFQAAMPLLGLALGYGFRNELAEFGPIIGFVLLMLVGLKMLHDALTSDGSAPRAGLKETRTLITLAIATSIDALVIGILFNFVPVNLPLAIGVIGGVTFVTCLAGFYIGKASKKMLGSRVQVWGAVALIALAVKTLFV